MIWIEDEPLEAAGAIESLLDERFGPQRRLKTAERLREGSHPAVGLSFVARDGAALVGTVRFWPLRIGTDRAALLLGPLAVASHRCGEGIGSQLIHRGLTAAFHLGHRAVILVGNLSYYGRFGFRPDATERLVLPGPVDRRRFLGLELAAGSLSGASGPVRAAPAEGVQPWYCRRAA